MAVIKTGEQLSVAYLYRPGPGAFKKSYLDSERTRLFTNCRLWNRLAAVPELCHPQKKTIRNLVSSLNSSKLFSMFYRWWILRTTRDFQQGFYCYSLLKVIMVSANLNNCNLILNKSNQILGNANFR